MTKLTSYETGLWLVRYEGASPMGRRFTFEHAMFCMALDAVFGDA